MEEEPPSRPSVAWEESGSSRSRTPPPEPSEEMEVQVLSDDADWLPVYKEEKEAVDCIKAYTCDVHGEKDLDQKMQFLNSISALCNTAARTGLTEGLDVFCSKNSLAKNIRTLHAMDEMLQIAVDNYPTPSVTEELHGILEVCLLPSSVPRGLSDRICCALFMGTALGAAGVAISSSQANQKLFSSQVLLPFTSSLINDVHDRAMSFAESLRPSERTDFVLMTLEKIIKDSRVEDKERAIIIMDAILTEPGIWLMDYSNSSNLPVSSNQVPQILGFIHRNLGSISTSLQHILFSVVDVLINEFPRDALMSVLTQLPQSDSSTLDIWRLMLHLPHPALIVEELYSVLHDQQLCEIFNISTAELGLLHLPVARSPAASVRLSPLPFFQVMPPTEGTLKDLCKPAALQNILKTESLPILWLGLRGLLLLSERRETAREIWALLPNIMETTSTGNAHIILEALRIFKNVMRHMGMREASSSAVTVAEKMLPLFNHVSPLWEAKLRPPILLPQVSSEVREGSIRLFRDLMEAVVWWQKGSMKKNVRGGLLPLLLRMSDEIPSVAQAAGETVVTCAKFLRWKRLKRAAQEQNTLRIRDCLLCENRKRVVGYLRQSLPYLKDPQASVRFEAVRFIPLQPSEDDDHLGVRSLATATILMMKPKKPPASNKKERSLEEIII
ncbi:hypothetical protein ASZ78_013307 [Callipepla squamata]|uniref:Uncharacterized protein n=1 Tax=Callipepla squamata TaxID=9009 RepID=A0A226MVB1_CALSU|nr:hypothetical protein ASZ78_013307 [Callipepla squamata]